MSRVCSNCLYYEDNMDGWGVCTAPLPICIRVAYEFDIEKNTNADQCECWTDD